MRIAGKISAVLLLVAAAANAQPKVPAGSIVNNASYIPFGLPNWAIAQGSIFAVFGSGMGPASLVKATSFPLPTTQGLAGTSVKVTVADTTVNAIMLYSLDGQVGAVLPSNTPVGDGTFTVTYNGQTSASVAIHVVKSAPGIFAINSGGNGPGVITDVNFAPDLVTASAAPGQAMIIWATGIGPVSGDEAAGPTPGAAPSGATVEVFVGGKSANVIAFGRSGCCAGLDQIALTVPAGVEGCYVPVVIRVNGVVSNTVTMSISSSGKVCSDVTGYSSSDLQKIANGTGSLNVGGISLARITTQTSAPPPVGNSSITSDVGSGVFFRVNYSQVVSSSGGSGIGYAPYGSCNVTYFTGSSSASAVSFTYLDAGPVLNVNGPKGIKQLPKGTGATAGIYFATLGSNTSGLYLDKGTYTVDNGSGGADIGPFKATLNVADPLTWTNQGSINTIQRSQDLLITWTGGDPNSFVTITGTSTSSSPVVGGSFTCTAPISAGQFTVPSIVLSTLPPSATNAFNIGTGSLALTTIPLYSVGRFTAPGLDVGGIIYNNTIGKNVAYQ